MNKKSRYFLFLVFPIFIVSCSTRSEVSKAESPVKESFFNLSVACEVPLPREVEEASEARGIAKDAAVSLGQNKLLSYIIRKRTRSGKSLEMAAIPSLELQEALQNYVKEAVVNHLKFTSKTCSLNLTLSKKKLKIFLRKN